ncbi:MAG: hypothetical protein NVSMB21_23340 [Vulcanimicrobiaceae bacterium]
MKPHPVDDASLSPARFARAAVLALLWCERVVFFSIGALLFLAAFALLKESVLVLYKMYFGGGLPATAYGSRFLDVVLLVLMVVELAYTIILSLRGAVLVAEPFLIVGLIAVIRRMLVITVDDVGGTKAGVSTSVPELATLMAIVLVFVGSIVILRRESRRPAPLREGDPLAAAPHRDGEA